MQPKQKKRMSPWVMVPAVLLSLVIIERIVRIVYSSFDSNVMYRGTIVPDIFSYAAEIIGVLFLSVAVAAIAYMTVYGSWKNGVIMLFVSLAVLTVLPLSGWAVDVLTHNFYGYELELLAQAFLREESKPIPMILAFFFALWARKSKKLTVSRVIIITAVLYALLLLASVAYGIVMFFMEYSYPTAAEISAMVQDVIYPLFFSGILLGGGALLFVPLLEKTKESSL